MSHNVFSVSTLSARIGAWQIASAAGLVVFTACSGDHRQPASLEDVPLAVLEFDCRIDAHEADLVPITWLGVSKTGVVALIQGQDRAVRFFDSSCQPMGRIGRQGQGPGEFERPLRGGWKGDTLWVSDTELSHVTIISPELKYVRTLPPLTGVRPRPGDEGRIATYSLAAPNAVFESDTLLVIGLMPINAPPDAAGPVLLRATAEGIIEQEAVRLPETGKNGFVEMGAVPFYPTPEWTVAADGSRIAILTFNADGAQQPASFQVTAFDSRGREVFRRAVPYEPVSIPAAVADSVVAARAERSLMRRPTPAMVSEMRAAIPATYPPASRVVVGSDGRFWVNLLDEPGGSPWLILDPQGRLVSRILLPRRQRIAAADAEAVWAVERDDMGVESVLKYRLRL